MVHFSESIDKIEKDFLDNGISIVEPGFYNDANFLRIESADLRYLNNYARYVDLKKYSDVYLKRAEIEIPQITELLFKELEKDGRLGACIDASMVLSKILEKEGYWNYTVKGALTIIFKTQQGLREKFFWPIDKTEAKAAHVWLIAPPFRVIDITVRQQRYYENEQQYLPEYIIEKANGFCDIRAEDIISDLCRTEIASAHRTPNKRILQTHCPNILDFAKIFPPNRIERNKVSFKYI